MKRTNWHTYFWDLDGTITDPLRGIVGAYQALLKEYGAAPQDDASLKWVIGPPLRECLPQVLNISTSLEIEQAVVRYRHWYVTEGLMYLDTPYEGIEPLLSQLKNRGGRLLVATAKAHSYARQILEHWNLAHYFENIHGSELDGARSNKAELLAWILDEYQLEPTKEIVMIGDRRHDVVAGKVHGLSTIGVGYGYGSEAELREAGADLFCSTVSELYNTLI